MKAKATKAPNRNVSTAAPAKFQVGTRVVADFWKGGKIPGILRKDCRVPGLITAIKGRFLRTPDFARWTYLVRLDRQFCSQDLWELDEGYLKIEAVK